MSANKRNIIVTMWMSLDGYVSGPDDNMDFVGKFYDEAMGDYENKLVANADTLILGRRTYDSFAGSWPKVPDNPNVSEQERQYARMLNAMQKKVYSKTMAESSTAADWEGTTIFKDIDPEEVKAWKQQDGKDMVIYGSTSIIQQLSNLGLIDEYQILVHPIVLGAGKPLFANMQEQLTLKLVDSKTMASGVVYLTYRPAKVSE